ncbi:MAG: hypothetical protein V1885_00860 [Candidatus Brennerbacteria bacterium]
MTPIIKFFDKLEDKVRGWLSHYPILYGIIGGIGTVLAWRGIWHTTDFISTHYFQNGTEGVLGTMNYPVLWDGLASLIIGVAILLATGLFVAGFIGDHILISGLRHEKKVTEKTEEEVEEEAVRLKGLKVQLDRIEKRLEEMKK